MKYRSNSPDMLHHVFFLFLWHRKRQILETSHFMIRVNHECHFLLTNSLSDLLQILTVTSRFVQEGGQDQCKQRLKIFFPRSLLVWRLKNLKKTWRFHAAFPFHKMNSAAPHYPFPVPAEVCPTLKTEARRKGSRRVGSHLKSEYEINTSRWKRSGVPPSSGVSGSDVHSCGRWLRSFSTLCIRNNDWWNCLRLLNKCFREILLQLTDDCFNHISVKLHSKQSVLLPNTEHKTDLSSRFPFVHSDKDWRTDWLSV